MSEFCQTLGYVFLPFVAMLTLASILPAAGCALYIRNETLLAIALPPLAGAILPLGVLLGISPDDHVVLLALSFFITLLVIVIIVNLRLSELRRQIILASLFACGGVLTNLLMSVPSSAHAHLGFLLSGELLALDRREALLTFILVFLCWIGFVKFKNAVFAYCIDEEMMKLRTPFFRIFSVVYRIQIVVLISASVLFIGPLLTSSLLVFPPFTADTGRNSLGYFFTLGVFSGIFGAGLGFLIGIVADIPPAYTASIAVLIVGIVLKLLNSVVAVQ